ncbi:MAG: hypothetical protein M3163_02955 [Actinomycetota bacterium]|nr:hypothetical protein [Actinomycetota bacterium]
MKRLVALLPALLLWALLGPTQAALADGTETLGPPSIPIQTGSGVASGGTGMNTQPGTIELTVPPGATIKQVLAYWEGEQYSGDTPGDAPGDDTIVIDGVEVTGTLIGGPVEFFFDQGQLVDASSFRADITALGLVNPGANSLTVSGLSFTYENEGASIVVIYDDGSGPAVIDVRDGIDIAWKLFEDPKKATTQPQTFAFPAAGITRTAQMHLAVGSVEQGRPNSVEITAGPVVVTHVLSSNEEPDWDNAILPVEILPGVASVTVEVISGTDQSSYESASLAWVNAIFTLSGVNACSVTSTAPQTTHGSTYGVDVKTANSTLVNKLGDVATVAPGSPSSAAKKGLNVNLTGTVSAKVLGTQSDSSLAPSPNSTSSATVSDVNLLSGAIRATTVRGVSQSVASPNGASYNSKGSTFEDLKINGKTVVDVAPNTKLQVKNPLLPAQTLADAYLYEEVGSTSSANGAFTAKHHTNMIRVVLLQPFLSLPKGAQIIVAHAESFAQSPQTTCPTGKSVSGEAFTALASTSLAGSQLTYTKVGDAVLPPSGGSNSDGTNASVPGLVSSTTASNTTSGSLDPNPNATSRSVVEGANVLGGVVTAKVLDVRSKSSADGTTAGTTLQATFVDLKVGGATVDVNVKPNSAMYVSLQGGGYVFVILNEQVVNSNGTSDTEGTINAVHAFVYTSGGLLEAEVIVASAHSDAHV